MNAYAPGRPNRLRGLLLMIGASLCWSTGGFLMRSTEIANGWEIVFWRSLFMMLSLFLSPSRSQRPCTMLPFSQ